MPREWLKMKAYYLKVVRFNLVIGSCTSFRECRGNEILVQSRQLSRSQSPALTLIYLLCRRATLSSGWGNEGNQMKDVTLPFEQVVACKE